MGAGPWTRQKNSNRFGGLRHAEPGIGPEAVVGDPPWAVLPTRDSRSASPERDASRAANRDSIKRPLSGRDIRPI